MPIRSGLKSSLMTLGALTLIGVLGAPVVAQTSANRQALLGVRLYDSYKTVLQKYGPPQEVQSGASFAMPGGAAQASTGGGAKGGGMAGAPGGMMGAGAPPGMMQSMMAGMMGGGRGAGGATSGPPPGMMQGMMGMMGGGRPGGAGGGLPGFSGAKGGGMGADDEMPTLMGQSGRMGGGTPGAKGAGAGGAGGSAEANEAENGEAFWWYTIKRRDPANKERQIVFYMGFLFNKDGKVIQIQQYGYAGGQKTAKGVGLGDSLNRLLKTYGWSNDGERNGDKLTFRYGSSEKYAFQLVRDQVVGITLAAVKAPLPPAPPATPGF